MYSENPDGQLSPFSADAVAGGVLDPAIPVAGAVVVGATALGRAVAVVVVVVVRTGGTVVVAATGGAVVGAAAGAPGIVATRHTLPCRIWPGGQVCASAAPGIAMATVPRIASPIYPFRIDTSISSERDLPLVSERERKLSVPNWTAGRTAA